MASKNNLIVFTISNKQNHHLERLQKSAVKNNIQLHVHGMGEVFKGHGKKRILIHQFLKSCDPDQLFLFVDAFDVIFLTGIEEMLEKYTKLFSGKLVFGAEQNLGMYSFDDLYYFLKYPIKNKRYKYLNSGTLIGPVSKGIELFETLGVNDEKIKMDQVGIIRHFTKFPNRDIVVDSEQELFAVNGGRAGLELTDYTIKNNRLYSNTTNNWPTLLHVPGKFFIGLDQLAMQLGFMDSIPTYTKAEEKAYLSATKDHKLCDRFGIENYTLRVIKNWSVNLLIIVFIYSLVRWALSIFTF